MNGWHLVSGGKCNNRTAMHAHEAVGHDHETAARFAAKRGNGGFNFGVVAHRRDNRPHTERPRRSLEGWSEIASAARCGIRVEHQREAASPLGAASWSSSSHLPPIVASTLTKPVMLPPGRASDAMNPSLTGSDAI